MFRAAPTCFLIASPSAEVFRDTVREACASNGVELISVETASLRSASTGDVADAIERADCVVANLSDGRPNAFFELGVAHGMRKRILTMSEKRPDLPGDIGGLQILFYQPGDPRLVNHISEWLQEVVAVAV